MQNYYVPINMLINYRKQKISQHGRANFTIVKQDQSVQFNMAIEPS